MDSKDNCFLINNKLPKCISCIYEYYCDWNKDDCVYNKTITEKEGIKQFENRAN